MQCNCNIDKKTFGFQNIPLNCMATWRLLSSGHTKSLFQLDKQLGREWSKKVQPGNLEELSDLISLIRPGALDSGMADLYVKRKNKEEYIEYLTPKLEPILKDTQGVLCYQEQILEIAKKLAGFNLEEADSLRKAIGKKIPELMTECKILFKKKAKEIKILTEKEADQIFDWIEKSQKYLFNKSHAVSYASLGYKMAYAKTHFPLEFFTSCLSFALYKQDPREEIAELIQDARFFEIDIVPPNIQQKNIDFMIGDDNKILFGLSHIKGIGRAALKKIIQNKDKLGTWFDFLKNISKINRGVAESLIKSGACDCYGKSRNRMLTELHVILGQSVRDEQGKIKTLTGLSPKEYKFFYANYNGGDLEDFLQIMLDKSIPHNQTRTSILINYRDLLKMPIYVDTNTQRALAEKYYLGISLSCSAVDDVETEGYDNCLDAAKSLSTVKTCGIIEKVKITKTKKGKNPGQIMCFLTISDSTYIIDSIVVFPNEYQDYKQFLNVDQIIGLYGNKKGQSIIVTEIVNII